MPDNAKKIKTEGCFINIDCDSKDTCFKVKNKFKI